MEFLSTRHDFQWKRKLFHLFNGTLGFYLYVYSGFQKSHVLLFLAFCVGVNLVLDCLRMTHAGFRHWFANRFSGFMRGYERKGLTSATKGLGMALVVLLIFPEFVGILVMLFITYGDTAGGVVGPLWGKHKLNSHASWEGCFAVFVVCVLCTLYAVYFLAEGFGLSLTQMILFSVISGVIGAFSEAALPHTDDNLTLPLLAAPLLWLLMMLFQIPFTEVV